MRVANAGAKIQHYVSQFDMARFLNADLLAALQLFHFPAYSNIYTQQDELHIFYFLVEGQVQCNYYHPNGKVAVSALATPFTTMGDMEILSEERLVSNVIAMQDTLMLGINRADIERYGADDPHFLRFLLEQMRKKFFGSASLQMNQVLPVINRLAAYLLTQPTVTNQDAIMLPDKEVLASLLGTTPRHLNRVLKKLVESEIISAGYPLVRIRNKQALHDLTA